MFCSLGLWAQEKFSERDVNFSNKPVPMSGQTFVTGYATQEDRSQTHSTWKSISLTQTEIVYFCCRNRGEEQSRGIIWEEGKQVKINK